ncbi:MAG: hypothetical protein ABJB12_10610 [Pseudomonadota bacterium]
MTVAGESYQQVLCRLRTLRNRASALKPEIDLIPIEYFGIPATLATFEILGDLSCVALWGSRFTPPIPNSPFFGLARRRSLD